ncbi:hypothetical protein [Nocardioides zeae]
MSSKKPHLVKLKGKGLDGTGVTDAVARQMCSAKGRRYMAVVEVTVDTLHDKLEGQVVADLTLDQFWPATSTSLSDHLRELTRTLHQNKGIEEARASGDQPLDFEDGPSPKVADVLAHGGRFRPHPYLASTLSTEDEPVCDVCGEMEDAPAHAAAAEGAPDETGEPDERDDAEGTEGDGDEHNDDGPGEGAEEDAGEEDPDEPEEEPVDALAPVTTPRPTPNPFAPHGMGVPDDVA